MKTAVVTGATSGIGYAVVQALLRRGWRVIGVGHTRENSDAALARLKACMPDADTRFVCADLAQQSGVSLAAEEISSLLDEGGGRLDALLSNAGAVRNWYTTTEQGFELQFALNYLAGFLLTHRLLKYLKASGGKLILTGSNSHKHAKIHWNDVMLQKRYNPLTAYKQSKFAQMLFANEFNRCYKNEGVQAYVVDPGLVNTGIGSKQTGGITKLFWELHRHRGVKPETVAQTYVHLCENEPEGLYFHDKDACSYDRRADSPEDGKRLFDLSEQLCGITFGEGDRK